MDTLRLLQKDRRRKDIWRNLYMVRHGESTANEVNRFAGAIDAPLTDLGQAQARRAGNDWRGEHIDQVYVSPLERARQTAQIILETMPAGTVAANQTQFDPRLSERYFGEFTLQNKTRLQRRFGLRNYEASLYRGDAALHGGESFEEFRDRVLEFLKTEVYPAISSGKRVLVVAHKYVIELMSRLILRLPEVEGYDLRLPNARILHGDELGRYVEGESPERNFANDWVVVHHSLVLAGAACLGLLINAMGLRATIPPGVLLSLLLVATTISLARISLRNPSAMADRKKLLSPSQLLIRFLLLPWGVTALGGWLWPAHGTDISSTLIAVVLLLAAPTAVTATILSRSAGGMILPSVYIILLSTAMSAVNTTALLAWFGMSDLAFQALVFVGLSVSTLVLPMAVAYYMRSYHPIVTAKFAEDYAAVAVLALAFFVVLAFQNVHLDTFYPMGILAIGIGVALRLLAVRTARHRSLYGLDDYFSTSYPNIFLVILLANLVGNAAALDLATWFLVPMFMLAPMDDRLILRLQKAQPEFHLLKYLRIHHPGEEGSSSHKHP